MRSLSRWHRNSGSGHDGLNSITRDRYHRPNRSHRRRPHHAGRCRTIPSGPRVTAGNGQEPHCGPQPRSIFCFTIGTRGINLAPSVLQHGRGIMRISIRNGTLLDLITYKGSECCLLAILEAILVGVWNSRLSSRMSLAVRNWRRSYLIPPYSY